MQCTRKHFENENKNKKKQHKTKTYRYLVSDRKYLELNNPLMILTIPVLLIRLMGHTEFTVATEYTAGINKSVFQQHMHTYSEMGWELKKKVFLPWKINDEMNCRWS